jgi:hypothetical protein
MFGLGGRPSSCREQPGRSQNGKLQGGRTGRLRYGVIEVVFLAFLPFLPWRSGSITNPSYRGAVLALLGIGIGSSVKRNERTLQESAALIGLLGHGGGDPLSQLAAKLEPGARNDQTHRHPSYTQIMSVIAGRMRWYRAVFVYRVFKGKAGKGPDTEAGAIVQVQG